MSVALDMQLALGTATGIGEYARGLAGALQAQGESIVELCEPRLDPWRFDRRVLWDQILLPRAARASGAQLLHCLSGTMPLRLRMPAIVTVHDVAWLKVQRHTRAYARYYFGAFSVARYRAARAIVVDSAFSRDELLNAIDVPQERVHVVYPGVAQDFCSIVRAPSEEPLILVPGTVERRKNLEVLIRALPALPGVRLVSVGPFTPYREECERFARDAGVADRVEFRGYVPRSELLQLYARCALVAVPSRYEGFGYAAAQALCAGAPLIVSDRASLPEVVNGAAPAICADDDSAWAGEIGKLLQNAAESRSRADAARQDATKRYAWHTAAARMRELYAAGT